MQATNRYRGGLASYLEVTSAQTPALVNQRTAVAILTRRMTASVLLLKGLGGGWRRPPELNSYGLDAVRSQRRAS